MMTGIVNLSFSAAQQTASYSQSYSHPQPQGTHSAPLLREARSHFDRARTLDAENVVALSFLDQVKAYSFYTPY